MGSPPFRLAIVPLCFAGVLVAPVYLPGLPGSGDSDLFGEGVREPEAQARIQAAVKRGFQTRDGEMTLAHVLGDR